MQIIGKEEMLKKYRQIPKKKLYEDFREKVKKLFPLIFECIENDSGMVISDIAKEYSLGESDMTIYSKLKYILFFEGISVSKKYKDGHDCVFFSKMRHSGGLSKTMLDKFNSTDLDGWYIKRDFELSFRHILKRDSKGKGTGNMFLLESEGDISFDRRSMTESQAIEFAKYMSSGDIQATGVIYNTPINIRLPENWRYNRITLDKIGREFRIIRNDENNRNNRNGDNFNNGNNDNLFTVISIYGREWVVHEYEVDELIKFGSIYGILNGADRALEIERLPETIAILKKIISEMVEKKKIGEIKGIVIDENKRILIVNNSVGIFHISLLDATLHKINYGPNGCEIKTYICVGPANRYDGFIIHKNGIRYEVSRNMSIILSKMIMLLNENYPDESTKNQIYFK